MTAVLRHAGFRRLALLYTLNALLEWIGSVALMVITYSATESPVVAAAMLLCKQVLPSVAVPALADKLDRLRPGLAMALAALTQVVALASLALLGYTALVFPLALAAGAGSALTRGVIRATVSKTLPDGELRAGNAVLNVVIGIVGPAAPVLAAVLIAAADPRAALWAAAVGLLFVALVALRFALPEDGPIQEHSASQPQAAARARRAESSVPMGALLALGVVATCVSTLDEPSLLAYAQTSLGAGLGAYGAIFTAQAVGVAVGSVLFGRLLSWPMLRIYAFATTLIGLGFLGMAAAPSVGIALACATVVGIGMGMDWVAIVTAVQEAAEPGHETRAAARIEVAGMVGPGLGLLIGGIVAEFVSPRVPLLLSGAVALLALLVGLVLLRARDTRRTQVQPVSPVLLSPTFPGGSV